MGARIHELLLRMTLEQKARCGRRLAIRQPICEMAARAVDLLLGMLGREPEDHRRLEVPSVLIFRHSPAPAPGRLRASRAAMPAAPLPRPD